MARKIEEIFNSIIEKKKAEPALAGLTDSTSFSTFFQKIWNYIFNDNRSNSKVSVWRLWVYITAYAIWTLETLFDVHKAEVSDIILQQKPHSKTWYRNKAKAFQYGFDLYDDTDVFNNEEFTEEQIENSKIIKYSAVTEAVNESRLIIKIAGEDANGELSPIPAPEKESFDAYVEEFRDAGVKVTVINYPPDILRLDLEIFYDPLVLAADGTRILEGEGSGTRPVETALKEFMKELPFDGELSINSLNDKLQETAGVKEPHLISAASKWLAADGSEGVFENIAVFKIPVSGYFEIENFNNIKYFAK